MWIQLARVSLGAKQGESKISHKQNHSSEFHSAVVFYG